LSPAESPVTIDFVLAQFNNAIKALGELQTKSVNRFTSTAHSTRTNSERPPLPVSNDTDLCDVTYTCEDCGAIATRTIKIEK
jgi:hypothetical protein